MRVVCTGISCSGRKELLADFERLCRERGQAAQFFNVGDQMRLEAARAGVHFTDAKVLDSDPAVLALARRNALLEILRQHSPQAPAFIGLHACFRWRGVLLEGMTFDDMQEVAPDLFINVVDDISRIEERMRRNPQWQSLTRTEINVWLDEEEFLTRQYAAFLGKPYYVVAREHDLANFYDLIFTRKQKFYLSFPITLMADEQVKRIRGYGEWFREHFVVFDPLYVKDVQVGQDAAGEGTVSEIDARTIEAIKQRTITRDYQFVRQSDFVVVLYLTDKLSPGVLAEMNFASRYNKPVYAVYEHRASPFFENLCSRMFRTVEELRDFLIRGHGAA